MRIRGNPWQKNFYSRSAKPSHPVVVRPAPALRRHPRNDLVRIGDVAGLAVYTIRGIQADALAVWLRRVVHHLVHVRRTKILAWAAVFLHAALIAHLRIVDDQVGRLILFVFRSGMI